MTRLCCPVCRSTTLSGAAPSYQCMDCECRFRIEQRGEREVDRISGKPLTDTPMF